MSDEQPISVQIMDSDYRIACPPDEQDALAAAAQLLNDTMQGIRNTGKVSGVERIAVMAALNISYELLNLQKQSARLEQVVNNRLKLLHRQVDALARKLKQQQELELQQQTEQDLV